MQAEIRDHSVTDVLDEMRALEIKAEADGRELSADDLEDMDKEARAWVINIGC